MKVTLFLTSIFFLLGLKVSQLLDIKGNQATVDQIISNKIINSKQLKEAPFFNAFEYRNTGKEKKIKQDIHEKVTPKDSIPVK
jgi:hypothetical protein